MANQLALFDSPVAERPNLGEYDLIVLDSSAGKDSLCMLDVVAEELTGLERKPRVVVIHANLGRSEWAGVPELAKRQAERYGWEFCQVTNQKRDILTQTQERGMWPSPAMRWCTSDHKRTPLQKALRSYSPKTQGKRWRVLHCQGLRAQESRKRAKMEAFEQAGAQSNGVRTVDEWLPLHVWTEAEVWQRIKAKGLEYHPAYDLGMPRLSCVFCIYAPRDALLLAGQHNRALLAEHVRVEQAAGHTFQHGLSLKSVQEALERGEEAQAIPSWEM